MKQQYGIHLTSRLQADGESKEAKWADIDDDEDDWAPETIEWNDGTKTTLAATDVNIVAGQKPPSDFSMAEQPAQPEVIKMRPPQFTSSVGPNATVLKLGANAERQQAQRALAEKARSPLEKPRTSSSGAPAPAPSKSPWASLPPVDKASPVFINPQPMGPPRLPSQDYRQNPAANMTAPSPATEISADDFNRAWRDGPSSQPRELFMPNSGRYEAVPENRRRMSKNDQNFRAPAVLQRPSQSESYGPAEPSAAFQTHRTSTDVSRRRASSTLSGGSGQLARRMSIKSSEMAPPVFDSQARPPSQDGPSEQAQTPTNQARGDPMAAIGPAGAPAPGPGPVPAPYDIEAERTKQKAEMKQRIEQARRRKDEEQAREEAEKQERIRQKLASLAPLPPSEKVKLEEAIVQGEHVRKESGASADARAVPVTGVTHSPPKPPQPLATGEPQQYGMMKVHPMDTVTKLGPVGSQSMSKSRDQHDDTARMPPPSATMRPASLNATEPSPKLSKSASAGGDARNGWSDVADQRAPASALGSLGNLWGVPSNKALGNGTFDQTLAGYAPQDLSRASSTAQGWMGRTPTAGRSPQPQYLNHNGPENRSQGPASLISPEATPLAVDSEADSMFPTVRPAPIGPPQQHAPQSRANGMGGGPQSNGTLAAWHNFHQVAGQQERVESEKYQRDLAAKREEEARTGVRQGPQYSFNETWKKIDAGEQAGQRQLSNVYQNAAPTSSSFGAVGQPARGSRFFPPGSSGHAQQDRRAVTYSHPEVARSPSPPPAEEYESYHPAFDGDKRYPAVRLPMAKPVVNLPPAAPLTPPSPIPAAMSTEPEQPLSWAARAAMPAAPRTPTLRAASTPIAQNPTWQERFNGLLKTTAAAKTSPTMAVQALAVTSSTREPLDVLAPAVSASVSMPQQSGPGPVEGAELSSSNRVEEEEDLFEDRELASLPTINLPLQPLVSAPLATVPRRWPLPVDASSVDHLFMVNYPTGKLRPNAAAFAIIRMFPSMRSIRKDLPQKAGAGSVGMQKPRIPSHSHGMKSTRGRGGKAFRQGSKGH